MLQFLSSVSLYGWGLFIYLFYIYFLKLKKKRKEIYIYIKGEKLPLILTNYFIYLLNLFYLFFFE